MAVLENIRSGKWWLIIIIGIAMLAFLIPYDAVIAMFNKGANAPAGEVAGQDISIVEYQNELQRRDQLFDYSNNNSLENEVWNDLVERSILADNYQDLGIDVSEEEYDEIRFGTILSPFVKSSFYGGQDDQAKRDQWKQNFQVWYSDNPGLYNGYTDVIVNRRKREKFNNLVSKGVYANSLEAEYDYVFGQRKVNIKYVLKSFDDIPDSLFNVSESEIRSYYSAHKEDKEYQQTKGRDIQYVKYDVEPTTADIEAIKTSLTETKSKWTAKDSATGDEAFFSKLPFGNSFQTLKLKKEEYESLSVSDQLISSPIGSVVGPYEEGNMIRIAKINARGVVPDSAVSCRHILLKAKDVKDVIEMATLQARADSIERAYKRGADWDELCKKHSEDPGSQNKGGVYESFRRGKMVAPFEDFCFDNSVGSIGSVETSYGIHLIEVTGQEWTSDEITLAIIEQEKVASKETNDAIFDLASSMSIDFSNQADFLANADTSGLSLLDAKNIIPGSSRIAQLPSPASVIAWVYNQDTEVGEVSMPIKAGSSWVVATLTQAREKGVPTYENVKEAMEVEVLKEKKGKMYVDMMKDGSLQDIAEAVGSTVKQGRNLTLRTDKIAGTTVNDPEIVGLSFAVPVGEISYPIVGEGGIWVVAPQEAPTEAEAKDSYLEDQDKLINTVRGAAGTYIFNAMKEGANVEDTRPGH